MKFGDQLHGTITDIDAKGRGLFTYTLPNPNDGTRTVAVPFTTIGDTVRATFERREAGIWQARLTNVEVRAPERVTAPCPHAAVCGGCLWQHVGYEQQLHLKTQALRLAMKKADIDDSLLEVIGAVETLHFRNRMDYVVGWQGEIGLKEYGSWNRYIDIKSCLLMDERAMPILAIARSWMKIHNLMPWDARRHTGDLRYVVIRRGINTRECMVTLVVHNNERISDIARQDIVTQLSPLTTTIYLGENSTPTDVSTCRSLTLLNGAPWLRERVNDLEFLIHPNAFFQTNTLAAAKLQTTVLDWLADKQYKSILDLYCGSGFFALGLAKHGKTVYGHEIDEQAIETAQANADMNNLRTVTFAAGSVEDLAWDHMKPQAIVLDPPRAGLHPRVIETVLKNAPPTIIYVSCKYQRFMQEFAQLKSAYRCTGIKAIDMFPNTPHVEVMVRLEHA